ncbi:MAG TPA: RNHCP domain-containing protein [Oligoflexus sp.]|uniref:RNHCP domain-containing protein n=1 Tax=Oligoflexus sp. TaxID=1971216 RepID=UPI002D80E4A3|nr:RNHCP domain-containing protein [Oligoflexus sp.]HET9241477.1 RNHCP domain-containing protein [Oligoflexus sp.]
MSEPTLGKFQKINESFLCENCGASVPPAKRTCRNHCPHCLHSKHVDVYPGDRANSCQGLLRPIGYELNGKKGLVLLFRCARCKAETRNIALLDDPILSDDYQKILDLTPRAPLH